MFSDVMVEKWAKGAAYIAYHVLGLNNYNCDYTVTVVNYHAPKGTWLPASTTTAQATILL